ncbi:MULTISPECIES: conjugal transfer protein TrbF [Sphingopyxis]|uniref:Type IV secretion system protein VirB5 n=1 Tax=Sphingopyxis panaciterrulae TaxID=462372 RepID=A0A7W9EQB8_9SPHN|nr:MULTISPECIES: conjugal transfer protein TrbF [Sphingopyxis]MBB5706334.1 type IV secretion system protein VirB5 [Sphingopyxis panaciterrulae]MCW0197157.1 conjugal transfer protein TrbF [Sphingopyxis sp.]
MRFKRAVQRYGQTPEPETPYQRAGQLWDERIGAARVQAKNWRLMAFGGLLLTAGLSSALIWQSMQSHVVPYVVEVDTLGEAQAVAPADTEYQATDPQIAWHLGKFIVNVRSRSLDPVLMRENWLSAYDFATERASLFLGEYARADNPFADVGRRTVSVQVTSVVRASDSSFQVKWTEQAYERGSLSGTSRWTAMLTVKVQPPRSAEVLRKNPLGLYIDAIDWSRELDTDVLKPLDRFPRPDELVAPEPPADMPIDPEPPQTPERNEP